MFQSIRFTSGSSGHRELLQKPAKQEAFLNKRQIGPESTSQPRPNSLSPTDYSTLTMVPATLFLLAHQDDEFGVFFEIEDTLANGGRAICVYLTDGGAR